MSFRPPRSLPILTLFHNVKSDKSRAALSLLQARQKNAQGEEKYKIDIMDEDKSAPTDTQLKQIASYLNSPHPWKDMILDDNGITNAHDAFSVLEKKPQLLNVPIVVDWENGNAAIGSKTLDAVERLINQRK